MQNEAKAQIIVGMDFRRMRASCMHHIHVRELEISYILIFLIGFFSFPSTPQPPNRGTSLL